MNGKKSIVICDTNIWYGIGEGTIEENVFNDVHLVGTFVSAYELSHSPAIYKKTEIWKRSVDAFFPIAN
ncbi:hypothetical protein [Dyadobacter frigoris]|uniref:PIN domain-containing protein n=1 Tax=Dyadobacter frigoris TaxID=2576211 RepID=A0A4U6D5L4_9BACT|nr:hypothetical protein [Dyadobacter frigoris]TKT92649.1 hypothetical protein FDK13_07490 [Dyadobacter frigoris]